MELRLLLATLVRRFEFSVPPEAVTDMTPSMRFALRPRSGSFKVVATHRCPS